MRTSMPQPRPVRPQPEAGAPPTLRVVDPAPERWRDAHEHATPTSGLLFLIAALALREGLLFGGSTLALVAGIVCLAVSVGVPLASRLLAPRRRALPPPACKPGR